MVHCKAGGKSVLPELSSWDRPDELWHTRSIGTEGKLG